MIRPLLKVRLTITVIALQISLLISSANAAWFESTGEAAIINGNMELARQNATQEAIRQALWFAGASVQSVQKIANGVLQNDDLVIRATGEVNSVELIDEIHHDGFISVSVRADIFSQQKQCKTSSLAKGLVTTWSPLRDKQQATTGQVFKIGEKLPELLQRSFTQYAQFSYISEIMPFYTSALSSRNLEQVTALAKKANAQYVLSAQIEDIGMRTPQKSAWKFWEEQPDLRQFGYQVAVLDGFTGTKVWQKTYQIEAPWDFNRYQAVDVGSSRLWQSQYGEAILNVMMDVAIQVDETLSCLPAYGRVIQVQNEQLMVNIGKNQGLKKGDELQLFQVMQFHDPQGQIQAKYNLHPTSVTIESVYANSASAVSSDNTILANIQTNDFVSIR